MKKIIIDQGGPLPISVQIDDPGDVPVIFEVSGSCYTNESIGWTGINLEINGNTVAQSKIWANNLNVHQATVTKAYSVNLDPTHGTQGKHTIALTNMPNTITDKDWFTVTMHF